MSLFFSPMSMRIKIMRLDSRLQFDTEFVGVKAIPMLGYLWMSINITADVSPSWRSWLLGTDPNTQTHRSYGSRLRDSETNCSQMASEQMAECLSKSI